MARAVLEGWPQALFFVIAVSKARQELAPQEMTCYDSGLLINLKCHDVFSPIVDDVSLPGQSRNCRHRGRLASPAEREP